MEERLYIKTITNCIFCPNICNSINDPTSPLYEKSQINGTYCYVTKKIIPNEYLALWNGVEGFPEWCPLKTVDEINEKFEITRK